MSDFNFLNIFPNARLVLVKKGELLLRAGEFNGNVFLVEKGCLRSYTIDSKGKEHIFQFAPEGWIINDLDAIVENMPATLNIDAVEDTRVKVISRPPDNDLSVLEKELLVEMNRKFQRRIAALQKRIIQLLSFTAEERYREFTLTYPSLSQRVPLKMIASYLGITPESLSRVRKEMVRTN